MENKDTILIREMTKEDAAEVALVEEACFKFPWSRQAFWEEVQNENALYLVMEIDGSIFGYMGAWLIEKEAHITNVAIHPKYQKKGLGHKLVKKMLERCKEKNITSSTLEVRPSNAPAIALYEKLGFKSVGIRPKYYEDGEGAMIMWLTKLDEKL